MSHINKTQIRIIEAFENSVRPDLKCSSKMAEKISGINATRYWRLKTGLADMKLKEASILNQITRARLRLR